MIYKEKRGKNRKWKKKCYETKGLQVVLLTAWGFSE